jgi:peptidoglycan/xylan/chitin deacetylase (PgdA/CDA1 family)
LPRYAKRLARASASHLVGGFLGSVVSLRTGEGIIVLTYDDGPDPGSTPQVLDALRRHGLTATFFVLVERAAKHPELLRRVVDDGHQVGLHGLDHQRLTSMSRQRAHEHVATGKRELESLLGQRVHYFRPPYGAQSVHTLNSARRLALTTVLWSASAWDWRSVSQRERVEGALLECRPGAILLAHDAFGSSVGDGCAEPPAVDRAELLSMLVVALQDKGYRFVSLAEGLSTSPARRLVILSK